MAVLNPARWARRASRVCRTALGGVALAWLAAPAADAQPRVALEYAVKANYLYKFAPFVEWPPRAFAAADSPFMICVSGEDPFGSLLDEAVRDQRIEGRPIRVRRMAANASPAGCQVLFLGRARSAAAAEMQRSLAGRPLLTVADDPQGVSGAMIQFVLHEGRVRFRIDAAAAEASGLPISSKLLGLALTVKR